MKRYIFKIVLICFLQTIFVAASLAQNKLIDSLTTVIGNLPDDTNKLDVMYALNRQLVITGQYDEVLKNLEIMQTLTDKLARRADAKKKNYQDRLKSETARIQNLKGVVYFRQSKYPEALESYFKVLKIRQEMNDRKGLAMVSNNISGVYSNLSDDLNQLKYLELATSNFEAVNDLTGLGQSYYNQSLYYFKRGDYDKSIETNFKALRYSEQAGDKVSITHCHLHTGAIYYQMNNIAKSNEYYSRALDLAKETGDKVGLVFIYSNMGVNYKHTGNSAKAFESFNKSLEMSLELGDKKNSADNYQNLGGLYVDLQNSYLNKGDTLIARVYADSAITLYGKARQIYEDLGEKSEHASGLLKLGRLHIVRGNFDSAEEYLKRGLAMAMETNDKRVKMHAYLCFSELNAANGHPAQALEFYKLYTITKDSTLNEASTRSILELDKRYETEQKEKQIALLEKQAQIDRIQLALKQELIRQQALIDKDKSQQLLLVSKDNKIKDLTLLQQKIELEHRGSENIKKQHEVTLLQQETELQQLSLQKATQQQQFAIAGIIALILFGGFTYYRFRQRKKLSDRLSRSLIELHQTQEQLIETEKRRELERVRLRISRDIHDEIGSNLTKITLLSDIVVADSGKISEELKKSATDISVYAQEVNDSLGEIVWAVNPGQDTLDSLLAYMRNHIHSFLRDTGIAFTIDFPEVEPNVQLDPELKRSLYLSLKESLNNAVKYAQAKNIYIRFIIQNKIFQLSILDDGIGFDQGHLDRFGNGLHNMQYRMDQCGCRLQVRSSPGNGCEVIASGSIEIAKPVDMA